jgi:hypothetical protein
MVQPPGPAIACHSHLIWASFTFSQPPKAPLTKEEKAAREAAALKARDEAKAYLQSQGGWPQLEPLFGIGCVRCPPTVPVLPDAV